MNANPTHSETCAREQARQIHWISVFTNRAFQKGTACMTPMRAPARQARWQQMRMARSGSSYARLNSAALGNGAMGSLLSRSICSAFSPASVSIRAPSRRKVIRLSTPYGLDNQHPYVTRAQTMYEQVVTSSSETGWCCAKRTTVSMSNQVACKHVKTFRTPFLLLLSLISSSISLKLRSCGDL